MAKIYHFWMGVPYGTLTETHLDNSIENRDIELDSFDKNPH